VPRLIDVIPRVFESIQARMTSEMPVGLSTGLPQLDEMLGGGWNRQELTYLVGDSGVGKSWLTLWWILVGAKWLAEHPDERPMSGYIVLDSDDEIRQHIHQKEGKLPIILFWSLEMAELPVVVRLLTQTAKLVTGEDFDSTKLKRGDFGTPTTPLSHDIEDQEWQQRAKDLYFAYLTLHTKWAKHIIAEFNTRSIDDFADILDETARHFDIVMIVVDYFRLIDESRSEGNVVASQEERSRQLSGIAKDYDCHVLAVFDINRLGERAKRVGLQHMRGGVAAKYDADTVLILERGDKPDRIVNEYPIEVRLVLKMEKNRFGKQGSLQLHMNLATGHVEQWFMREGGKDADN